MTIMCKETRSGEITSTQVRVSRYQSRRCDHPEVDRPHSGALMAQGPADFLAHCGRWPGRALRGGQRECSHVLVLSRLLDSLLSEGCGQQTGPRREDDGVRAAASGVRMETGHLLAGVTVLIVSEIVSKNDIEGELQRGVVRWARRSLGARAGRVVNLMGESGEKKQSYF